MKTTRITTLLAAACLLTATAVWAKNVKTADKDNDGTLDKNEAKALPIVAKNFDAIDTDKDGTVDQIEIDSERDRWFTAEQAKAYGIVDNVIVKRGELL
jgi:cytochrome oxidase Cu insertion factor (SCO1/SenC/PrrC family)